MDSSISVKNPEEKMFFKKYIFSLTVLTLLISGCANSQEIIVKAGSGDQTIIAKAGKNFTIAIEAQLSTGYSWKLQELPASIKIVNEAVLTEKKNVNITGGYEIQEFVFKSAEKGNYTLTFNYAQHWKKKPEFEKTAVIKVKVE
jgi:inhibitor of cysteine peptidase